MAHTMYTVKRTGRTWSIFHNGAIVEGGFFDRAVAVEACEEWTRGTRNH